MNRPRVLCVSGDRATRASITLSLTDTPVNVVVAQRSSEAIDRLARQSVDAVVVDATTIEHVRRVVDAVATETPETPTFVQWGTDDRGDGDAGAVLSEVVARDDAGPSIRLADAITSRLDADSSERDDRETDAVATADATATADTGGTAGTAATDVIGDPGDTDIPGDPSDTDIPGDADGPDDPSDTDIPGDADGPDDLSGGRPAPLAAIDDVVRRRLVEVTSPVAVERILREEFVASDRFAFAWVGEYDRGEREIVPWLTDPASMAWPMQRTFAVGGGEQPLLERALRSGDLQTTDDLAADPDGVPFGTHAVDRGVRAAAVVPLSSSDDVYGVFVVYARERLSAPERETIRSAAAAASYILETIAIRGQLDQQERALQRYERLVETAGDGMCILDEQGHVMTVNDALTEMTGYSREGLLGEHASIVFDADDIAAGEETIRSLLSSGGGTDTIELTLETKAGERIPCEAQIAVLVRDGEFLGSVAVVRDITERKRSERKLREQNERLDAFAQIVSHDLRNPLSVAQGYLDLLEETDSLEYADQVRDGLDRMESIIEDVLAIAHDGEWATDAEPVDLEAVIDEAWEYVSTADASRSIAQLTTVQADRSRLLRLFENLFRNAIEHGGTDVTVRIGLLEAGGEPHGFYVEDDGAGLPEALRERLFDPSVSGSSEGFGIGLWVVREVATGHGWSVTATESKDGGARFEFEFESSDYCSD